VSRRTDIQTEAATEEEGWSCLISQLEHTVFGPECCGRFNSGNVQYNKR